MRRISIVAQDLDLAGELVRPLLHILAHAPLARFDHADEARLVPLDRAGGFAGEAASIVLGVQLHVIDRPAGILQLGGEMAHGGKDQDDLLLVMLDVGRLVPDLHHQDDRIVFGPPAQRSQGAGQLIAENGNEDGAGAVRCHARLTVHGHRRFRTENYPAFVLAPLSSSSSSLSIAMAPTGTGPPPALACSNRAIASLAERLSEWGLLAMILSRAIAES